MVTGLIGILLVFRLWISFDCMILSFIFDLSNKKLFYFLKF